MLLAEHVPKITDIYVRVEVLKGKYEADTVWNKEMKLEKPIGISLTLDVTNLNKDEVLEVAKTIQQTLHEENYKYSEVILTEICLINTWMKKKIEAI